MGDQHRIVDELHRAALHGDTVILASIVRTEGSTYRRVGARMLVRGDNTTAGLLSGGCLESDLVEHAKRVRETGCSEHIVYDSRSDDDLVWGLGLGCNGLIDVLLEPLPPDRADGRARELATELPNRGEIIVCGSGPDAVPVVRLATELDWAVTVVDHRPDALSRPNRFPGARIVECRDALQLADVVSCTPATVTIIMSHHYGRDLDYLDALVAADVAYIGVLGPKRRTDRMLADLAQRGRFVSTTMRERIYGPIGLDLGGDSPDAIALSIVAEVSAFIHHRSGTHLRDRHAPIHADTTGEQNAAASSLSATPDSLLARAG